MRKPKNGKPIIVIAILVIVICGIVCAVGQSQMNAAKEEYGRSFNATYYYWPGEQMRDTAGAWVAIGVCILIWGVVLTVQAKKDANVKDLLADVTNVNGQDKLK